MSGTSLAYRSGLRLARGLLPLATPLSPKLAHGHAGRAGVGARLQRWGRSQRDRTRPLVWLHASSVGEGLQAESILTQLRLAQPGWQYAYTHFSPSAALLAQRLPVDLADFLPYDLPGPVEQALDALAPAALIFTKLDLWPELATRAAARGVPVLLLAATVSPNSGRLHWLVRRLLAPGYRVVAAAGAIAEADGARLARLGVPAEHIRVTGDPRADSVLDRVAAVAPDDPLLHLAEGPATLVAGSTWPRDEAVVLDAFARLHVHRPEARLILVPHEPTEEHLAGVARRAQALGAPAPVRLSRLSGPSPLILVDRVGALATLYGAGAMAYVGGGFGRAGLHSVLEPAAWGIPVVFGPRWQESRDASELLAAGGAEALAELGTAETGESLQRLWDDWVEHPARREAQGRRARAVVEAGRGAAARSAEVALRAVDQRARPGYSTMTPS